MKNLILVLASASLFTACASMKEAWVNQNCNKDAGYSQGMNDARNQVDMDVAKYNEMCGNAGEVTTAYREGYAEGIKSLHVDDSFNNSGTIINVDLGGRSIGIGGGLNKPAVNPKAWFCEVSAFTNHYEAWGPTQLEARKSAGAACTAANHEMHCKEVKCKKNL